MTPVDTLRADLFKLSLSEAKTRTIKEYVNTLSRLEPYAPWSILPSEYLATPENRDTMPKFTFGLRFASHDDMVEFATRLAPDRASSLRADPNAVIATIYVHLNNVCQLERGNKILFEGIYSKENETVIALASTYNSRKTGLEAKIMKLQEELERIGWEDRELKWYISADNRKERTNWCIPLFEEEEELATS